MKKILLAFLLVFASANAEAAKAIDPIKNQSVQVMGGADSDRNIIPFLVNPDGSISSQDAFGTVRAGRITVTANGATDRTQGPDIAVNSCTFRSLSSNGDIVYAGGSTVTNNSGANPGFPLGIGDGIGPVTLSNLNQIYFAADDANDKLAYFCN